MQPGRQAQSSTSKGKVFNILIECQVWSHTPSAHQCSAQCHRYVVEDLPNNILCAAVFDGHGGAECSEYCAHNLKVKWSHNFMDFFSSFNLTFILNL